MIVTKLVRCVCANVNDKRVIKALRIAEGKFIEVVVEPVASS